MPKNRLITLAVSTVLFVGGIVATAAPAAAAVPTDNAFPIQGRDAGVCANSFGAPRSGGRTHEGDDCFAPVGTPLVAVESGVILVADNTNNHTCGTSGDLGGITIWLGGDSGTAYYYAHNSRNVVATGQRVVKGQVIAYVGNTGNACSTSPHLHFQIHPGGRGTAAVNPYPYLQQWSSAPLPWRPLCYPVTGDWDGNGTDTLGVACKDGVEYEWGLMNFNGGGSAQIVGRFGNAVDCLPVTGDWDGNGTDTIGVACRSGAGVTWALVNGFQGSPSYPVFGFGNADNCWPVTGDWDGNGTDTIGVACKDGIGLAWAGMNFHGGGSAQMTGGYGNSDLCHPVVGNWDGTGGDTVGAACRSGVGMTWSLVNGFQGSPSYPVFGFGNSDNCRPVTGNWDGSGGDTIGVACKAGHGMSWAMMNFHGGGTPQITAGFGNGDSYQYTTGWPGPRWPNWPAP
jgi:hypothetical protein